MTTSTRDLLVGAFVLLGIGALAYLSIALGGLSYAGPGGLTLFATFDEIGSLAPGAAVAIGGVRVGEVQSVTLDDEFRARIELDLDPDLRLPDDTSATIYTQGVLGNQYVSLQPGASDEYLRSGDEIALTQGATVLERLLGRLVQSLGQD